MISKIQKLAISAAAAAGIMLAPASAMAFGPPPSSTSLQCKLAQSRFTVATARLNAIDKQIAGYQKAISSLQSTQSVLIGKGLGESAAYQSVSKTIQYYQNLISVLQQKRSTLANQHEEAAFYMLISCYPFWELT